MRPNLNSQGEVKIDILFRSKDQHIKFNYPKECGVYETKEKAFNVEEHAEINFHEFEENDIIVVGSDGFFDNVFDNSIGICLGSDMTGVDL